MTHAPRMKLWAISDLHVRHKANAAAVEAIPAHPEDWLILAGDLGETEQHLRFVLSTLAPRFAQLLWVPGNHELWSTKKSPEAGVPRYEALVAVCREYGVLTPEDPYPTWPGDGQTVVCPLFLLYDYSFAPDGLDVDAALAWARETGVVCTDEWYLKPTPYPTRQAWCAARVEATEARLAALGGRPTVLTNHWQLRADLARLPRVPRFLIWCGTAATSDWHRRFRATAVVSGHLHLRTTDWRDGTRFEEVSLGYPRHYRAEEPVGRYLREILPGPSRAPTGGSGGPIWHR